MISKVRADCPKSRKLLPGLVKRVSASKHSFSAIHFQSYSLGTFQEYYPSHKWWIKDEFKTTDTFWKVNPSKSQNLHIFHMLSSSKGKNSCTEYFFTQDILGILKSPFSLSQWLSLFKNTFIYRYIQIFHELYTCTYIVNEKPNSMEWWFIHPPIQFTKLSAWSKMARITICPYSEIQMLTIWFLLPGILSLILPHLALLLT